MMHLVAPRCGDVEVGQGAAAKNVPPCMTK